nr:DNA polymerase [Pigeon adenovirus 1]
MAASALSRRGRRPRAPAPLPPTLLGPEASQRLRLRGPGASGDARRFFRTPTTDRQGLTRAVFYYQDQPVKVLTAPFETGLRKFLRTHRFLVGRSPYSKHYDRFDYAWYARDPAVRLLHFRPRFVGLLLFRGYQLSVRRLSPRPHDEGAGEEEEEGEEASPPVLPPMLLVRLDGRWLWAALSAVHKCPRCGLAWSRRHVCNVSRAAFYHHVNHDGREHWQHVYFRCPAASPQTRLLFLTYDIETYTAYQTRGKRLRPFMLCFKLSGDPGLVAQAERIARLDDALQPLDGGYYWLDARPGVVARRFRQYRHRLQVEFARRLVDRFCRHNSAYVQRLMREGGYESRYDVPHELFREPQEPLALPEDFYSVDVVILGHNISKFDELLLAAEFVENRQDFPRAAQCVRAFMPRVGRLLFNDVRFSMPNPRFRRRDPERLERWALGQLHVADEADVHVRFMVRDTCQLTSGASLARAASAYALELCKGHCAYEAINELYSFGRYDSDPDGFPVERYWESPQALQEQRDLWRQRHPDRPYDLVRACLEYCMQDVLVTERLAHVLYDNYDAYYRRELGMLGRFNIFERPTIPSNTHAFWKQVTFSAYVKRRRQRRPDGADRREKLSPDYLAEVYAPHQAMFKYIRQALRGGRCYPTVLGPYAHPVYVFDICGMYASALTHPMPHGMPLHPLDVRDHVDFLNRLLADPAPLSYFDERIKPSILKIDATPPPIEDLDPLPPLCTRRGGRLVWTNEPLYDEVVVVVDIVTLHNRGWRVRVRQDPMNVVFPRWETLCAEYVAKNIAAKEKADQEKNEVLRSISKMLSNALYGAFATNMDATSVRFEQDLTDGEMRDIWDGVKVVKQVTYLCDPSLHDRPVVAGPAVGAAATTAAAVVVSGNSLPPTSPRSVRIFPPSLTEVNDDEDVENEGSDDDGDGEAALLRVDRELEAAAMRGPFIPPPGEDPASVAHAAANDVRPKPLHLADADAAAVTVLHLERLDKLVDNHRYATQLACFVLGWSRAFFSEWAEILHEPDRGVHPHRRPARSLYGDTDSLFVTASGYERMRTRGRHRIKGPGTRLTYDPEHPALYWACECDIKCKKCGADTYSSEAVFLAPKLYGLKDAVCTDPACGHVGQGKIRSKGHKQAELIYDTLLKCWNKREDEAYGAVSRQPELYTRRNIFKTTLLNKVSRYEPFSIHAERLVRVLRPWQEPTLYAHGDFLYPYDLLHPNPRALGDRLVREDRVCPDAEPLAPLRLLSASLPALDGFRA